MNPIKSALLVVLILLLAGCTQGATEKPGEKPGSGNSSTSSSSLASQPYAGLEKREIRALDSQRVNDLLEGNGAGYALAGELNSYPGPSHALQFQDTLLLDTEQKQAIQQITTSMKREAASQGARVVSLEVELDRAFATKTISSPDLTRLTHEIAVEEGRLRAVHLAAHLEVKEILTPQQIATYNDLRGYGKEAAPTLTEPSQRPQGNEGHNSSKRH